jgi:hypothetical protein
MRIFSENENAFHQIQTLFLILKKSGQNEYTIILGKLIAWQDRIEELIDLMTQMEKPKILQPILWIVICHRLFNP